MRPGRALGAAVVGGGLLSGCFALSFLGALHDPQPHQLPVAIVAPSPVRSALGAELGLHSPGAFVLRAYPSASAARVAVADRVVDGALVVGPGQAEVLVAGAGGQAGMQSLEAAFGALARGLHTPVIARDVVPLGPGDPLGLSSFFLVLSVTISSVAVGAAVGLGGRQTWIAQQVVALVCAAVAVGSVVTWVADYGLGALVGHPLALWGLAVLASLAVSLVTAGLAGAIGPAGVATTALVVVVLGLPATGGPAGLGSFLPAFFRPFHHSLPPGAALEAIRGAQYFTGHGVAGPAWVLVAWAAGGLAMLGAVGMLRRRRPEATDTATSPAPGVHAMGDAGGTLAG
ncbi:MAG: hypothetical protein ACYCZN_08770 [Candidatus Dormibacteria bacterium]